MVALYKWAHKSPLPAATTALCVFLAVIALNAVVEPASIMQGLIIKIIFISVMIACIKAALSERAYRERQELKNKEQVTTL